MSNVVSMAKRRQKMADDALRRMGTASLSDEGLKMAPSADMADLIAAWQAIGKELAAPVIGPVPSLRSPSTDR